VNPVNDKEVIDLELQLKDLDSVERRMQKLEKQAKAGDKEAKRQFDILSRYRDVLQQGKSARSVVLERPDDIEFASELYLLTNKPVLYVCNVDEGSALKGNRHVEAVRKSIENEGAELMIITAAMEAEIAQLETFEDKAAFLAEIGLDQPGVTEVRAWTIAMGTKAPQAAGVIHSDMEKGFIRAEVIKYNDFIQLGSESACRDNGKLAVEGKEYVVKDGDIMHFRFNV
jgi:ribosome-binding ATPase YchF (GTP1/OBG family)